MKKIYPTYEEAQRIVQEKGIKSQKEYHTSRRELGLPSEPHRIYKDNWICWAAFLGKTIVVFPTYEEAQRIVQEKGIKSQKEYNTSHKKLGLPSAPYLNYKEMWVSWGDFFGKSKVEYPPYDETQRIVQERGIKCNLDYLSLHKELGLPSDPQRYYKDSWISWEAFLGKTKVVFPTYEEAQRIVQKNGIKRRSDYTRSYKVLGLPSEPFTTYRSNWVDWATFFGVLKKKTIEERKIILLTKISINSDLLKEDAPLQIIYMLASKLDKKLAKEIENLLGTTSYEERLNWVKEQLKDIKEESSSVSKHNSDDELSVMESIIKDFDDITDTLSEADKSNLNAIIENYIHNAVNRGLISEYDG